MKLVSKIEIKTYAINIKELYIGFSQDNILHLINLFKASYDEDYYKGELYFKYEQNYSIYFKVITTHNIRENPFDTEPQPQEYKTQKFELGNYQSIYKIEIDENKMIVDSYYDDEYFYEYKIRQMRLYEK
jgi:hypothetical protein